MKIIQRGYNEPTPNWRVNPKNLKYDLDLEPFCQVMSSANHLDEGNIWVKSNENNSKGSGDMEQTQNSKGKSYDLELWPWDWVAESGATHTTILLRGLFEES